MLDIPKQALEGQTWGLKFFCNTIVFTILLELSGHIGKLTLALRASVYMTHIIRMVFSKSMSCTPR
jgi:hypothetical protein